MNAQLKYPVPDEWSDKYTEQDKAAVMEVLTYLNQPSCQLNKSRLSRLSRVHPTTANVILSGGYTCSPSHQLRSFLRVLGSEDGTPSGVQGQVRTSLFELLTAACRRAQHYRMFAVISAFVGTGKTTAVKAYARDNSEVILVDATPGMTASVLLNRLVDLTDAQPNKSNRWGRGTLADRMDAIIEKLRGTTSLLILDEAETVTAHTLEYFRRIADLAEIGAVLTGTERLMPMIRDPRGRFGQISSRVNFWPEPVRHITRDDAIALTEHLLPGEELSEEVIEAFWQMCDGSARVLCKSLIPGVRDYGLNKGHELSAELIYKVGQQILGYALPAGGAK